MGEVSDTAWAFYASASMHGKRQAIARRDLSRRPILDLAGWRCWRARGDSLCPACERRTMLRCHAERSEASAVRMERLYYVYILASRSQSLYIGVTNNIERRVEEHRSESVKGFTGRYNVNRLVHVEVFHDVRAAIAREKQLKGWRREKKLALIESGNPTWVELAPRGSLARRPTADPSLRSG